MIEETMNQHRQTGFERQDLSAQVVFAFLIGLTATGMVICFVLWGVYHYADTYEKSHQLSGSLLARTTETDTRDTNPAVVRAEIETKFSQPRLEGNERVEINDFRLREEQKLNSYGWVDEKSGVVHIPIERAMQLVAQRGLSTTPKVGVIPPSEVNVVNQAAARADVSNKSPQSKLKSPR
ncbi:MAG: hypothetical protein ABSA54_01315 [Terriglobales bacterium]|jgi:hypothetical protein